MPDSLNEFKLPRQSAEKPQMEYRKSGREFPAGPLLAAAGRSPNSARTAEPKRPAAPFREG